MESPVVLENNSGSARTDYLSNHNLSNRARQRSKHLKEKTSPVSKSQEVTEQGQFCFPLTRSIYWYLVTANHFDRIIMCIIFFL